MAFLITTARAGAGTRFNPSPVLLLESATDKLLIEGGTDAILLEGNQ